jgi:non-heme chloroperoxidase
MTLVRLTQGCAWSCTVALRRGAVLKVYEGASHGIAMVPGDKERFNADLLDFLKS